MYQWRGAANEARIAQSLRKRGRKWRRLKMCGMRASKNNAAEEKAMAYENAGALP